MIHRTLLSWAIFLVASSLIACGGGGTGPSAPTVAQVVKVQGDAQTGEVGQVLSTNPTVEIQDASGNPLSGQSVTFSVTSGGGSVSPTSTTTDVGGRASAIWTLGTSTGPTQRLTVTAASKSTVFTAQANAGPPTKIQATQGDDQAAEPGSTLSVPLTVQVVDQYANGVPGVAVTFSAASGSVSPQVATTDQDGKARTTATVGTVAELGGEASVIPATLPRPRQTVSYDQALEAARSTSFSATAPSVGSVTFTARVRSSTGTTWSVGSGGLPPGLSLSASGEISGIPTTLGQYQFTIVASEAGGSSVSQAYAIQVCDPPVSLAVGESMTTNPPSSGQCGIFLPSGADGDRYRVSVIWPSSSTQTDAAPVTLEIQGDGVSSSAPPLVSAAAPEGGFVVPAGRFADDLRRMEATERLHRRLLDGAKRLWSGLGPEALLPDLRGVARAPARAAAPDTRTFNVASNSCTTDAGTLTGVKIYESPDLVFYQDSSQRASTPVDSTLAKKAADFYESYGKRVIDGYFGGISDIDGNGKVIVLIAPSAPDVGKDALAFVLSRDFASTGDCPGSNHGEITYFSVDAFTAMAASSNPSYQALAALVHEVKHISSLYKRLQAGDLDQRPDWIEEGTADIAGEVASRFAWAATGGPTLDQPVLKGSFQSVTPENYGILIRLSRVVGTFSSQPNALTDNPAGASPSHTFYGSSWHLHRFIGDAFYGGIPNDSVFFRDQNSASADPGVAFFQNELGTSLQKLLQEQALEMMVNGQPAAAQVARNVISYNFPSAGEVFCSPNPLGAYPWPVTTTGTRTQGTCTTGYDPKTETFDPSASFSTATYDGSIGRGGIRVYDFLSNGTGEGAEINVDVGSPASADAKVVVVRLN